MFITNPTKPYTVLTVQHPTILSWLAMATVGPGTYYLQGDLTKLHLSVFERQKMLAGIYSLTLVADDMPVEPVITTVEPALPTDVVPLPTDVAQLPTDVAQLPTDVVPVPSFEKPVEPVIEAVDGEAGQPEEPVVVGEDVEPAGDKPE